MTCIRSILSLKIGLEQFLGTQYYAYIKLNAAYSSQKRFSAHSCRNTDTQSHTIVKPQALKNLVSANLFNCSWRLEMSKSLKSIRPETRYSSIFQIPPTVLGCLALSYYNCFSFFYPFSATYVNLFSESMGN